MMAAQASAAPAVRDLGNADLEHVVRIDDQHTGQPKPGYWKRVLADFMRGGDDRERVGLAAEIDGRMVGYLLGEVRAFEFGSEPCGWIFAVGVERDRLRGRVASSLLDEAGRRFKDSGVSRMRTMVRRNDVPVLSFFRANGFVGGEFVQLELDLKGEA